MAASRSISISASPHNRPAFSACLSIDVGSFLRPRVIGQSAVKVTEARELVLQVAPCQACGLVVVLLFLAHVVGEGVVPGGALLSGQQGQPLALRPEQSGCVV